MLAKKINNLVKCIIAAVVASLPLLNISAAQQQENTGVIISPAREQIITHTNISDTAPAGSNSNNQSIKSNTADIYRLSIFILSTAFLVLCVFAIRTSKANKALKDATQSLKSANKYGQLLLDSADNGIFGIDSQGNTTFVNNYLVKRTGWSKEDLINKNIHLIIHHSKDDKTPNNIEDCPVYWAIQKKDTHHVLDDIFWCKDGSYFHVEYTVTPIRENYGENGAVVVFKDITERIKTESGLRESEERLQAIINNTTAVITLKSPDGKYILVNERFEKTFELSGPDVHGMTDYDIFPSEQADIFQANDKKALESGMQQEFIEEMPQKDGMHTYLSIKFTLTRNDGYPYAICNVATDITERKRTEDTLRRAQKMEAIGQLTGGIAHDFNNLLGIIVGNLDLLQDELDDGSAKQHTKSALKAALRGSDLTRRLLSFSRKATPETKPLCINQVITDMQNLIEKSLTASISVHVSLNKDLWMTDINQGELEDAIINLAVNARDAMPDGGKLFITTSNSTIDEQYTKQHTGAEVGEYVLVSVRDTGSGINEDIIEKVLDPFFTTKPGSKGSGLGLSMVYGFVKRVRGYINLISKPNTGTTVEIFLPRSNQNSSCMDQNTSSEVIQQGGDETILVVDDEPDLALIAEGTLSKYGYHVLKAGTAAEAIDVLNKHPKVDLLFSDVVMPGGMDGLALAQYTKQNYPEIKILLASGFIHKTNKQQYEVSGYAMLRKPYRKTELIDQIRKTLDSK